VVNTQVPPYPRSLWSTQAETAPSPRYNPRCSLARWPISNDQMQPLTLMRLPTLAHTFTFGSGGGGGTYTGGGGGGG
jgi:hypothetical protein